MEESKPLWVVTQSINHPFRFITIGFIILGALGFLAVWLGYFEYDLLGYRDLLIWDEPSVVSWDKQVLARAHIQKNGGISKQKAIRSKSNQKWETVLTYENKQESNLPKEYLLKISKFEEEIK